MAMVFFSEHGISKTDFEESKGLGDIQKLSTTVQPLIEHKII